MNKKNHVLEHVAGIAEAAKDGDEGTYLHEIVDDMICALSASGFRQVVPPPFDQARIFSEHVGRLHEVELGSGERLVVPPTQIYNVLRYYQLLREKYGDTKVVKWFYVSPVAHSNPDKFAFAHEAGLFVFGKSSPLATIQVLRGAVQMLGHLGIDNTVIEINSVGCSSCREQYHDILGSHLIDSESKLCQECRSHIKDQAARVLRCENESCRELLAGAPQMVDFLEEDCRALLVGVLETMDELDLSYVLKPELYHGELIHQVIFRIRMDGDDEPSVLADGGDFSPATAVLGEKEIPAVGVKFALEDLLPLVSPDKIKPRDRVDVFVISLGDQATKSSLRLYETLRKAGIRVAESMLGNSSIKDQLKEAKAYEPQLAVIIGQKEALDETVILRDMRSSMQEVFTVDRIIEEVEKRLSR